MLKFRDKRYDSRHSRSTCYGIQHAFPFWEDQLTNPNKVMFPKAHTCDVTKEATMENKLSNNFDYLNFVTNFKWHSSRLKLRCSWILVNLPPFMQLATFFLLRLARQMEAICWRSVCEHRLGMTAPLSSFCALDALIAIFLSVPSRYGSCCNRTALCPLFRDVNCVECEVYYVKLLTVIREVNKRLTKICGLYILYGGGSDKRHSHSYVDGAHQHLAPQLFSHLNHSLTPNLLSC